MKGVGYRFRPKVQFLIQLLQYKAASGGDISGCTEVPGDVCELDLYGSGKEPWKVFSGGNEILELHDSNDPKKKIREKYVVTKLTKIGKKNVSRIAGVGSWDDQSTAKPIVYDGHEMGHWRTLTYEYCGGDGASEGKCYYNMNELHLSEHALRLAGVSGTDYVICKILKNLSKPCRIRQDRKRHLRQENSAAKVEDCPNTKRSRVMEENIVAVPQVEEELSHHQVFQECNDVPSDYVNFGPGSFPVSDLNFCGVVQEQHVASFYDPNIYGVARSQEQHVVSYHSDYPDLVCGDIQPNWVPACSSNFPGQDIRESNENWMQYLNAG